MTTNAPTRLISLDVFRGLVMASMVLVENPGSHVYSYSQLNHAKWFGMTFTDMIFPSFVFMMGLAIPYAFASRIERGASRGKLVMKILRRAAILILLGMLLYGFPHYDLHHQRIPGVLQRFGLCYAICGLIYLFAPKPANRRVVALALLAFACVALYWAVLRLAPVPGIGAGHLDSYGNFPAYIDRCVFGLNHMYAGGITPGMGVTYDPEGLLSTLPALFNTFAGILTAEFLRSPREARRKFLPMLATGVGLILVGMLLSHWMPLCKKLWTSTFAMTTSGISLTVFALLYFLVDIKQLRRGITPFLILGSNSIAVYMASNFGEIGLNWPIAALGETRTLRNWIYLHVYAPWLPPYAASLAYALGMVAFYMLVFWPLYRKRIFVRI